MGIKQVVGWQREDRCRRTQYRRARWIIVINVWATLGLGAFAAQAAPANADQGDHPWYREAARQALQQQTLPPVKVTSVTVEKNMLTAQIEVRDGFHGNSIDFVLAAPAGEITSASLTAHDTVDDTETVTAHRDWSTSGAWPGADYQREQSVFVKHLGYVRGHRLVKVQASPMLPGAAGARLKTGILKIHFTETISERPKPDTRNVITKGENSLDELVQQLVANPADLVRFDVPLDLTPFPADEAEGPPLGDRGAAVARFETAGEGFARFTGADLASIGVDLANTDVSRVSVWTDGEQQAVSAENAQSRPVEPNDEFIVYAQANQSTYTATRVHWIRTDKPALAPPMPAQSPSGSPASLVSTQHFMAHKTVQQDSPPVLTINDQFLTILGYRWVWWTWTPEGSGSELPQPRGYDEPGRIAFDLPGLADAKASASLALHFYAHKWPKETGPVAFNIALNGKAVGEIQVMEPENMEHTISFPSEILTADSNQVTLTPQLTTDTKTLPELCFDRLEVTYPRRYQLTSSTLEFTPPSDNGGMITLGVDKGSTTVLVADVSTTSPQISRNPVLNDKLIFQTKGPALRRYAAATPAGVKHVELQKVDLSIDLRSPQNRADLVVISWPEFIGDLKPWVDRKTAMGHIVKVVDVKDIYDQFGFGHLSPHAIRAFLRHAAIHWQGTDAGPAASVVLLVGDSTSAYRNEFQNDVINYVPTMRTTMGGDMFASDQWYVSLFGDDAFADALVGRFSVNSTEDLRNVLRKQLDYETASAPGAWQNTLGFIADHSEFEESVDRIMKQVVPPRFFLDRIMMSELSWIDNYYFPEEVAEAQKAKVSPAATGRIRDLFNNGAAVVTYFGHGSPNIWSTERMWFGGDSPNSDNLMLTNRDRLSIVINMTCNSGAIDYPQPRWNVCISEDFMRVPNGGAVACFVPSGPGLTVQHERLMMEVGRCLFGQDRRPLGYSLQLALWRYLAAGNPEELSRMYILLGDPLLRPHIATPVDASATANANVTQWPGTIVVPPDITGREGGGSFQLHNYGEHIDSRRIHQFTSATLALPLPETTPDSAQALSFSVQDNSTTAANSASTFVPIAGLPAVKLLQWKRLDNAADGDATATLEFRLRNDSPLPLRGIRIVVLDDQSGMFAGQSQPFNFEPLADGILRVDLAAAPGISTLRLSVSNGKETRPLESAVPVAIVGLRDDAMREQIAPAVVDKRSITTSYRQANDGVTATMTAQVYMLAREPLSNLRVGMEDPAGVVVESSVVTVPPAGPGEASRVSMSVTLPADGPTSNYKVRFDPAGFYPEFARFPVEAIALGSDGFSDVAIVSVVPSNTSPTDGETLFFDVTVANLGAAQADGIKVEGFLKVSSGTQEKLVSQVTLPTPLLNLKPGARESVLLRWDPFRNAGLNDLLFTATSINDIPDQDTANDQSTVAIVARTKAKLLPVEADVLPLSREDAATTQIRMLARIRNDGQTDAQGLRVTFYSSPGTSPDTYLGETELPMVPAGETKDAILPYKLKPGEESKPFKVTFEVMYKGSRQRILMQ